MNHVERCRLDSPPFRDLDASRSWMEQGIWPADWITLDPPPSAPCQLAFRFNFSVTTENSFRVHIAADEKYRLYLDGELIGFGSERGSIDRWPFDSYRLTCPPGDHTLVASVLAHGQAGLRSQMTLQPGFLLASEPPSLSTGHAAWEAKPLAGLEYVDHGPHAFFSVGKGTIHHGNKIDSAAPSGRGDGWQPVRKFHPGSTAGIRNRHPEIHLLTPATLPPPTRERFHGGRVVFLSSKFSQPLDASENLRDEAKSWNAAWQSNGEWSLPAGHTRTAIIDLEDYVCAWPRITLSASPGSSVSLLWNESFFTDDKYLHKGNRNEILGKYFTGHGDAFRAADDRAVTFEGPFIRTGRYLKITVTTRDHPLTFNFPHLLRAEYPLEITSHFEATGFPAADLIARCQRTLRASCHDAIIDGPFYEQMAWLGDTAQVAAVLFSATRDDRPLRKNIDLFDSSRLPNGNLRSRWPARDSAYVSGYAMYYGVLLHSHLWWRNDPAWLKSKLSGLRATLNYYLDLVGPDDLLKLTTGWPFADWVPGWNSGIPTMEPDGTSGLFQWQFIWALTCAVQLEEALGEPEMAQFYQRRARELARAAEVFWAPNTGLFADTRALTSFSEHTQAYAVLSRLLDGDKINTLRSKSVGFVHLSKATAAFAHYLYEAYLLLGQRDRIAEGLRACDRYDALGLLTTPEGPEPTRSDCHGWSAVPHFHLYASLLGIRPAAPHFRQVRIDPMWDLLGPINARFPHPGGEIVLHLSLVHGHPTGEVILPPMVTGKLVFPVGEVTLKPGSNLLGRS